MGPQILRVEEQLGLLKMNLTFFYADFVKEFPSRTLWRGPSQICPSPSSALCPLLYRTEHFLRAEKGENVPRKGEEEGWPAKGAKRKKGRENRSGMAEMAHPFMSTRAHKKGTRENLVKTLTSLNKEVRPFFLSDNSILSLPSVSSLSDYSIWSSWRRFYPCDHSIWSI